MQKLLMATTVALSSLTGFHPAKPPVGVATAKSQTAILAQKPAKGTRTMRLQGYLDLRGQGYVPHNSPWASITVSGYTELQDQDGHWLRGNIRFEDTHTYYINGNYVSDWVRPYAYVRVFDDQNRLLGTCRVEGSISVSGFKNGDWLNLDGSGYVNGTLTYQEQDPPKP